MTPVRLATYNLHGCIGVDGVRSVERVADVLRALDADVLCLQEVHRRLPQTRFEDQAARLQDLLGMPGVFQNNLRRVPGQYGLLTLARHPVRLVRRHVLPNTGEGIRWPGLLLERRGVLEVTVDVPGVRLTVLNTHWSLDEADRLACARLVAALVAGADGPVALCGDLNATPGSPGLAVLETVAGLFDAGSESGPCTFAAPEPTQRIDYVWLRPRPARAATQVVNTSASDHLPVVADVTWSVP